MLERQKLLEQLRSKFMPNNAKSKTNAQERESKMSMGFSFDDDIEDISVRTDGEGRSADQSGNKIDQAFKKL